jgi:membrane protein YqaA with SNARE-associated domain
MKLFSSLYNRTMVWARHPYAPLYLAALSFAESSFFPIPPDVMLAPMCLAKRDRAWFLAALTALASVLGGVLGYAIGFYAFSWIEPYIYEFGYGEAYNQSVAWFQEWGFWAVLVAGFSPIPYKVFTITAGALSMSFLPFTLASFIGRGSRFFLVAGLMRAGGSRMEEALKRYVDRIGWGVVAVIALFVLYSHLN